MMDIQRIKRTPITDLLSRLGHSPVKRSGREVWYRAPYREERTPSFRVNTEKNLWMDYGTGMGGDIFTLAGEFIHSKDFMEQARFIAEKSDLPLAVADVPQTGRCNNEPSFENVEIQPLKHYALTGYLAERGISAKIAAMHCCQLNYRVHGKPYFAVGFPNMAGGYEIRNKFFKGCVPPKDISLVKASENQENACNVFEGFIDCLSAMTLGMAKAEDCMVLNSVANIGKAVRQLAGYGRINCYLDNDDAGRRTLETLRKHFGDKVTDCSTLYEAHKDLNDYLRETNKKRNTFKVR